MIAAGGTKLCSYHADKGQIPWEMNGAAATPPRAWMTRNFSTRTPWAPEGQTRFGRGRETLAQLEAGLPK